MEGTPAIDRPRAVRAGEELDLAALRRFLQERGLGPARSEDGASPLTVEQFPGGHSNLTYRVRWGDAHWVLRRPPLGVAGKGAHDMGREHRVLTGLAPVYARAPRPVAWCEDATVLGAPFYLMEERVGVIVRRTVPAGMTLDEATARGLCEAFVEALAELHALDYEAAGLGELARGPGYAERQVRGWTERYERAMTDAVPAIERVAAWLASHLPAERPAALIHNDWKLDNLVLDPADPTRITAVLDWEMATVGDPLCDLGTALAYWVEATDAAPLRALGFGPTAAAGMFSRRQLVARYAEGTGAPIADAEAVFAYAFGLFKTAVVAQQIYARFARGLTQDARFAGFLDAVRLLAAQAEGAIAKGSV